MKKKKRYIVILVILVLFSLVMYLTIGKNEIAKEKRTITLIVRDNTIWNYSDGRWLNITSDNTIKNMSWLDYNVYMDNKSVGKYYLWYDDNKWYLFDKNKKAINKEGTILAYRSNYNVKVKNFTVNKISNFAPVQNTLRENNLIGYNQYTVADQVNIDIDNDGEKEEIYFISNAFSMDFYQNKVFSIVFMIKNGKIETLYKEIDENMSTNGCKPYLSAVIDIDEDNVYELIVSCGRYSVEKPVDMLYKLTDEGFKILISNQ